MVFAIQWHESAMGIHVSPILNAPPSQPPSPSHPSGLSQYSSFECPVSSIELGLVILFHIWYYTCFSAILSNHPTLSSHWITFKWVYHLLLIMLLRLIVSVGLMWWKYYTVVCYGTSLLNSVIWPLEQPMENIYIMEIGKCYNSGFFFLFLNS